MPISSLGPHREGPVVFCAWATETNALAAASAHKKRVTNMMFS
jgi:hypothetical protein